MSSTSASLPSLLLVMFGLLFTACCNCNQSAQSDSLRVEISSGGGFSGMHSGYIIEADGSVTGWSGMYGRKDSTWVVGKLEMKQMERLVRIAREDKTLEIGKNETGNMTTTLRVTLNDSAMNASWPGIDSNPDAAPEQAQQFLTVLYTYLDALRQ